MEINMSITIESCRFNLRLKIKTLIISLSIFGCSNLFALTYESYLNCMVEANQKFNISQNNCLPYASRYEKLKCLSTAYKRFATDVCAQGVALSLNSVSFMFKEMAEIDNPENRKVSPNEWLKKEERLKVLNRLILEEIEVAHAVTDDENQKMRTEYIASRKRSLDAEMAAQEQVSAANRADALDLLNKGLCMMAGNSPYALQNIGNCR